ncbi:hypothetical protein Mycch_3868 [Mycolicibacterium chubuense NBB4]|uniref:NB-ARC domain protein n=1 Tax=Mycolicibacterium chubuense (strain NBB4) TaxID=710421 RepID=I4BMT6_MYCCN|nr:hypothetical protein Mycch_3868 [Mycolicibacterium chubuense NBB4]
MVNGGQVAAYGFRYQYLAAAEHILRYLLDHPADLGAVSLTIEPARLDARRHGGADPDEVIDYSVNHQGVAVQRTQVKATRQPSPSSPLLPRVATTIFARMGPGAPGEGQPQILTNRPLSKKLRKQCGAPVSTTAAQSTYGLTTDSGLQGAIVEDHRSVADVKHSLLGLIGTVRADKALGLGNRSADLLMSALVDHIFDAAAGMSANTISAHDLLELLGTPDIELAHVLRGYDWGAPLAEVPRLVSVVPRIDTLMELTAMFNDSTATRTPAVAILRGTTGFGKSTIAADFCHLNRHLYEHITWVDSREPALMKARIKDILATMGVTVEPDSDVAALFRTEMGRMAGPFVLVFDNAASRDQIEPFVPTSGCGLTIVTTPSSATWWVSERRITVEGFTTEEAIHCFARYASVDAQVHREPIEEIVERLHRVPLAVAMAGLYFHDSDEDVANLSATYFDNLAALNVEANIPEGFDHTAFAAVQLAVSRLSEGNAGTDEHRRRSQQLIARAAVLAPELIPFNLILQALSGVDYSEPTNPPRPEVAERHSRNIIMQTLMTQTIARRRHYVDRTGEQNPASDTLNFHPLVHEILRNLQLQVSFPELIGPLTDLMACLYGWLEQMRHEGDFFPVDQLLMHSDHLLDFIDALDVTGPPSAVLDDFRRELTLLKCEAASAFSSRREYDSAVGLVRGALEDIMGVELSPRTRAIVAKASADAMTDIYQGGLDKDNVLLFAERLVDELQILERSDDPHAGEMSYLSADLGRRAMQSLGYAPTDPLVEELVRIAGRQNRSPSITGAVQQILAEIGSRQYRRALERIASASRQPGAQTSESEALLHQLAASALLHLQQFGEAAEIIETLLANDPYPHLADLYKELYAMLDTGLVFESPRWQSSPARNRLLQAQTEIRFRIAR